jgi:hypothetical protein
MQIFCWRHAVVSLPSQPLCGNSCRERGKVLPAINYTARTFFLMRVNGPNGTALASSPAPARRLTGGPITLGESNASPAPPPTVALRTVSGIDALIALQGVEDPLERRRRAVKHGRRALDALDQLKLDEPTALLRLKAVAADLKDGSGDEKLDQVLGEIELRVAVELAKAGVN